MGKRFAVTGGGTGGHLAIAGALADALRARGHEAIFIGSTSGQDRMWFEDSERFSQRYFLETTGVVNRKGLHRLAALWRIVKGWWRARSILSRHRVDGVISVGGFSAAPGALAALSRGTPLFIHEQNAATGRLNRMLRPYARAFFSSYEAASPVRDYPVAATFFERARVRRRIERIIFLGGSQGAAFINDLALAIAPLLAERGIALTHQCGERDFERVRDAYKAMGAEVNLVAFTRSLPELLEASDLAVSRAGASTLWELCATGLPALFVPYPYAAGDHQFHNAAFLVERGFGWCERQGPQVEALLRSLLDEDLEARSRGVMTLCGPGGAERLVAAVEEMLDA